MANYFISPIIHYSVFIQEIYEVSELLMCVREHHEEEAARDQVGEIESACAVYVCVCVCVACEHSACGVCVCVCVCVSPCV